MIDKYKLLEEANNKFNEQVVNFIANIEEYLQSKLKDNPAIEQICLPSDVFCYKLQYSTHRYSATVINKGLVNLRKNGYQIKFGKQIKGIWWWKEEVETNDLFISGWHNKTSNEQPYR